MKYFGAFDLKGSFLTKFLKLLPTIEISKILQYFLMFFQSNKHFDLMSSMGMLVNSRKISLTPSYTANPHTAGMSYVKKTRQSVSSGAIAMEVP